MNNPITKPGSIIQAAAYLLVGTLALRGAIAFYTQYVARNDIPEPASALAPAPLQTKAQRLQRASNFVSEMGKAGRVKEVFSAPDGSTGVVIDAPEGAFIGWMVEGVDAVWVGAKFDRKGNNQTQQEMIARGFARPSNTPTSTTSAQTPIPAPPITGTGVLQAVAQSPGFTEGSAGPLWTVYIDGNCGFCTQLWRNLRNPIAAGQLRVRWAPVAVVAPSSLGQAAALLQTDQPIVLLTQHANGAPLPTASPGQIQQQQIDANNAMLRALNAGKPAATPTIVLPSPQGARILTGLPPDLQTLLKESGT